MKGAYPPGHEQYQYDGDVNAQPITKTLPTVKEQMLALINANKEVGNLTSDDLSNILEELSTSTAVATLENNAQA